MIPAYFFIDKVHVTVRMDGQEKNYLLHKSNALICMDSNWLQNPHGDSQTSRFLKQQETFDGLLSPKGYGFILVDFDRKVIQSFQSYKDVTVMLMDDFGFYGGSSPTWMNWEKITSTAFENGCVTQAVYSGKNKGAKDIKVTLPEVVKSRSALALRFTSHNRPKDYLNFGMSFKQPGWSTVHTDVPANDVARRTVADRIRSRLKQLSVDVAPADQWTSFVTSF